MGVSAQFGSALKNQVFFLEWSDGPGPNSRKRGTGFFISPTIALTAYHNTVREDPDSTIEGQYGDSRITFRRVLAEPEYELAVLEVVKATPPLPDIAFERCVSLPVRDAETSLAWAGHAVSVVGYPREANFAKRSIQGHISHDAICNTKTATNGEFRDWVPAALAIRPDREGTLAGLDGMSGAPLYDFEHQAIVGIVFGIQNRMYAAQFAHLMERWTEAKRYITEATAPSILRLVAPSTSRSSAVADTQYPNKKAWMAGPAERWSSFSVTREPKTAEDFPVFLCHASGDKQAVRALYQRLREEGFTPWLDEENLLPGQDWEREISSAVRGSSVVLVCLSRVSVTKEGFVQKEIKYALDVADEKPEGIIFIIPVRLENCDVPARLRRWQWVNLFEDSGYSRLLSALRTRQETPRGRDSLGNDSEEEKIRRVLTATGGNKSRAAQILGIERRTLCRKLERMKM